MKGIKWLAMTLTLVITSFYFFPFEFIFLPGANTKMILAGIGLVLLGLNLARYGLGKMDRDLFHLSLWAAIVSLIGFISLTYNETIDYTYATYIVSMWVWLGGAYTVTLLMKKVHGVLHVELVCNYLIAVCVIQCIVAYIMGQNPVVKDFIDSFLASEGFMGRVEGRIYGVGASLDVAGMRFATILFIIAYLSIHSYNFYKGILYMLSFFTIAYIGNMIGRTTTIGIIISLIYWIYIYVAGTIVQQKALSQIMKIFSVVLIVVLPLIVFLYNNDINVHNNIRFAFEGFFSLVEKGRWETTSNEILKNMYVFPETIKTWLIGDGYFDNPFGSDPYYIGKKWAGFYMQTDVGYLRFIFYFGICGMLTFVAYMCTVGKICMRRFKNYRFLFCLILIINYIVWFKVSSDLFLVFALFLCISSEEQEEAEAMELEDVMETSEEA